MENITKEQAVELIKKEFELLTFEERQENKSFYVEKDGETTFYFDKKQYFRDMVIGKLVECFKGKNIVGGQCLIESVTFVWTVARVSDRKE